MKKASNELSDDILTQIFFTHTQQKKGEDEYYRKLHQENFDYGNAGGYIQEDLMEIIMLDEDEQDGGDHKGHPILIVDMWLDECEGDLFVYHRGAYGDKELSFSEKFFEYKAALRHHGLVGTNDCDAMPPAYFEGDGYDSEEE
tara:strand:- start:41 stop:469 length:429 start_codon:yes stop_codon:yes gene_type:complete